MTTDTTASSPIAPPTFGPRLPLLTGAVFLVTLACGIAQLAHRPLYDAVVRDAAHIDNGQWYRLVTAMFFQDGWAPGLVSNLILLAIFGTIAERAFGRWRWAILYFVCGWFGQLMSYLWLNPVGAGNSMCVAGLAGGLSTFILLSSRRYGFTPPLQLRITAFIIPALAIVSTALHDNHGLPCLLGMLLAYFLLPTSQSSGD
ncbi:rhomboid family intramembrane serine protease [Kribbella sp. NPDC000426]|uniref:rhomboid family intramembrane serine protease n=1 Tax=Kribbella sp. NPDC000426 TaxID=3154255 RepID=UPI00331953E0